MSLWDKLAREFLNIVEWTEPTQNEILAHRFPRADNEIKNGAKLVVREGQAAVFVKEGELADVMKPGTYNLDTPIMPILSKLLGWKYGFESPFKCEIYFVSTRQWTDRKWGTQNPVMMRDPEFGPVRLRAFGTYAFRVIDPGLFVKELVSTDPSFEAYEIADQLRNTVVSRLVDAVPRLQLPILDIVGNYDRLGKLAMEKIGPDLAGMGLGLTQFFVENLSLPPEVEAALDKRSSMSVLGNLDQYTKFQAAEAIRAPPRTPGGRGRGDRLWGGGGAREPDGQRDGGRGRREPRDFHGDAASCAVSGDVLRGAGRPASRAIRPGRARRQDPQRRDHEGHAALEGRHGQLDGRGGRRRRGPTVRGGAVAAADVK